MSFKPIVFYVPWVKNRNGLFLPKSSTLWFLQSVFFFYFFPFHFGKKMKGFNFAFEGKSVSKQSTDMITIWLRCGENKNAFCRDFSAIVDFLFLLWPAERLVNFINILRTAFTLVDPKSLKNTVKSSVSFYAFGIYKHM